MSNTGKIFPVLIAAIVSFITAIAACLIFFFVFYKPVQSSPGPPPGSTPERSAPTPAASEPIVSEKFNLSDVDTVNLRTNYRWFYAADSKCRTDVDPGMGESSSSPCSTTLTFNRDGSAAKSIETRAFYQDGKLIPASKTTWKADISAEQYNALLKSLSSGESFISWPQIEVYTSNFTITIKHGDKYMQWMSNITTKTTDQLPMVEAFQQLDSKIAWEMNNK